MKITKYVNEKAKNDGIGKVYTDAEVMAVLDEIFSKGIGGGVFQDYGLLMLVTSYIMEV